MYGFIKACAATFEIEVANVQHNEKLIIEKIKQADGQGAQITVFPELCVCGYTCGDLFNQQALLNGVKSAISKIADATKGCKTLAFIGAPIVFGGKLCNCAVAISDGKVLGVVPKSFLPNYGEFYERRHFSPADGIEGSIEIGGKEVPFGVNLLFKAVNYPELTVACEICEDLWVPDSPSVKHAQAGANVIVNLSCSNEVVGKAEYRRSLIKTQSAKLICGYVYCDAGDGESTTDMVFSGHSIISEYGETVAESKLFENGLLYGEIDVEKLNGERRKTAGVFYSDNNLPAHKTVEFELGEGSKQLMRTFPKMPFVPADGAALSQRTRLILSIQAKGLEKRLKHTKSKTAVVGISGGLDSALALLITRRAFVDMGKPLSDIIAITMPGFGTSGATYDNSLKLIKSLGATCKVIPIKDTVLSHFKDINQPADKFDVTYENSQARMRTMVLMDVANQTGGMVVGTGDLSELALGWATYNGDHMSMYGVNASVPKTLVKHLVRAEADSLGGDSKAVLYDILNTEISPELLPPDKDGKISQKTEDLVGPYILHDFFLYYAIRWGFGPKKVRYIANKTFKDDFSGEVIDKWLKNFYKRFFSQQFKRSCVPDGAKVGSVSLSPRGDWRMPSDACVQLWLKELDD